MDRIEKVVRKHKRMIRYKVRLITAFSLACFILLICKLQTILIIDQTPAKTSFIIASSGLLYLFSHILRAARLAVIAMPLAGVSFRTVGLLHLFVAPWSLVLPFKLDELLRFGELARAGRSWSRAFVAILIDRSVDGMVLLGIALFLSSQGYQSVAGFAGFVGLGLLLIASSFFMLPNFLESIQRYIFAHHYQPRAVVALRTTKYLRNVFQAGRTTIRNTLPFIIVATTGIWMLEGCAAFLFLDKAISFQSPLAQTLNLVLVRADVGWTTFLPSAPFESNGVYYLTAIFFLAVIIPWPWAAVSYDQRRLSEPRRSQLRMQFGNALTGGQSLKLIFLHDDRAKVPHLVRQIIGVDRFSEIVKRKVRLCDAIRKIADDEGIPYVRISDAQDWQNQIDAIERMSSDDMVLRLPSSLMPTDVPMFIQAIRKLPFAVESTVFGQIFGDETVALLRRDDVLQILSIDEGRERRAFLNTLAEKVQVVDDVSQFVDLRDVNSFLRFMIGATEARHFNATKVEDGVFRKFSNDKEKMRKEYTFFHIVPENMKRFLIPTFDFQENAEQASYGMESLSVPDAALQIIHGTFDPLSFERLLDSFFAFADSRKTKIVDSELVRQAIHKETVEKTEYRLELLMTTDVGVNLDSVLRASGPLGGVADLWRRASSVLKHAINKESSNALAVSHGDPCLSNILFNREIGLFRLIDPRGACDLEDSFMHPIYDVAKLSHSILGGYDFVNNGLFECQLDERQKLYLQLGGGGPPQWMREAFIRRLEIAGFNYDFVRAVEMSLFLSMLPFHVDVPRKLSAFCLIAGRLVEELEANQG